MKRTIILALCAICGFAASATPVWTKSTYEDADYTEVANRLNKGQTITYAQSWTKTKTTNATDGDISTYTSGGSGVLPGDTFVFVLTNDEW